MKNFQENYSEEIFHNVSSVQAYQTEFTIRVTSLLIQCSSRYSFCLKGLYSFINLHQNTCVRSMQVTLIGLLRQVAFSWNNIICVYDLTLMLVSETITVTKTRSWFYQIIRLKRYFRMHSYLLDECMSLNQLFVLYV